MTQKSMGQKLKPWVLQLQKFYPAVLLLLMRKGDDQNLKYLETIHFPV